MVGIMDLPAGRADVVLEAVAALDAGIPGPRFVLISGEAGIGKSTVFEAVARLTLPRLMTRAAEMERGLAYSTLTELLTGVLDEAIDALAPARASALLAALNLAEPGTAPPDARAAAMATHDLLLSLLEGGPIIIAIDDVQWVDDESATCLAFALRRLADKGLGALIARRSTGVRELPLGLGSTQQDVLELDLAPLSVGALGVVIGHRLGRDLPRPTLARIHQLARGNPLLAVELARTLPPDAVADELPSSPNVEKLIGRRVRALPADTIDLLLLVAASPFPTIDGLAGATGRTAVECAQLLGPHACDGLVEIEAGAIKVVHPLYTSAILNSVSPGALREAHAQLSTVTEGAERAMHLAASTDEPDELVAAVIEAAAQDLARRAAPAAAAVLAERAAELTPDSMEAGRRRLAAAAWYSTAADGDRSDRLSARVVADLPPCPTRARARARLFSPTTPDEEMAGALADAGDDPQAQAVVHATRSLILFLRMDMRGSQAASEAAAEAAERAGDTKLLIKSLVDSGFTKNILAAGSGMETLERALAIPDEPESHYDSPTAKIGLALTGMDRFDDARVALEAAAEACRLAGDEDGLGGMALHLIELEVRAGRLVAAQAWLDVHIEMTSGSGSWQSTHVSDYAESLVLAHRGDGERAVSVALRGHEHAERVGDVGFAMQLDRVAAIGQLRLGRYAEAADRLQRAHARLLDIGVDEPGGFPMHIDEIEALVGAGRLDEAAVRLAELQGLASTLGRTRLAGGALQCEGLLVTAQGDADAGIVLLAEATRTFDAGGFPWEAARARLAHGTALRRSRQRGAAREVLLEAEAGFEASGARGWADLAREEAARVSGRVASAGTLTETEERITDLVAEGLSNKDVAAQLFLSPKTVESHLSRIYAKLGVRTRTELAARRHQPPDA